MIDYEGLLATLKMKDIVQRMRGYPMQEMYYHALDMS